MSQRPLVPRGYIPPPSSVPPPLNSGNSSTHNRTYSSNVSANASASQFSTQMPPPPPMAPRILSSTHTDSSRLAGTSSQSSSVLPSVTSFPSNGNSHSTTKYPHNTSSMYSARPSVPVSGNLGYSQSSGMSDGNNKRAPLLPPPPPSQLFSSSQQHISSSINDIPMSQGKGSTTYASSQSHSTTNNPPSSNPPFSATSIPVSSSSTSVLSSSALVNASQTTGNDNLNMQIDNDTVSSSTTKLLSDPSFPIPTTTLTGSNTATSSSSSSTVPSTPLPKDLAEVETLPIQQQLEAFRSLLQARDGEVLFLRSKLKQMNDSLLNYQDTCATLEVEKTREVKLAKATAAKEVEALRSEASFRERELTESETKRQMVQRQVDGLKRAIEEGRGERERLRTQLEKVTQQLNDIQQVSLPNTKQSNNNEGTKEAMNEAAALLTANDNTGNKSVSNVPAMDIDTSAIVIDKKEIIGHPPPPSSSSVPSVPIKSSPTTTAFSPSGRNTTPLTNRNSAKRITSPPTSAAARMAALMDGQAHPMNSLKPNNSLTSTHNLSESQGKLSIASTTSLSSVASSKPLIIPETMPVTGTKNSNNGSNASSSTFNTSSNQPKNNTTTNFNDADRMKIDPPSASSSVTSAVTSVSSSALSSPSDPPSSSLQKLKETLLAQQKELEYQLRKYNEITLQRIRGILDMHTEQGYHRHITDIFFTVLRDEFLYLSGQAPAPATVNEYTIVLDAAMMEGKQQVYRELPKVSTVVPTFGAVTESSNPVNQRNDNDNDDMGTSSSLITPNKSLVPVTSTMLPVKNISSSTGLAKTPHGTTSISKGKSLGKSMSITISPGVTVLRQREALFGNSPFNHGKVQPTASLTYNGDETNDNRGNNLMASDKSNDNDTMDGVPGTVGIVGTSNGPGGGTEATDGKSSSITSVIFVNREFGYQMWDTVRSILDGTLTPLNLIHMLVSVAGLTSTGAHSLTRSSMLRSSAASSYNHTANDGSSSSKSSIGGGIRWYTQLCALRMIHHILKLYPQYVTAFDTYSGENSSSSTKSVTRVLPMETWKQRALAALQNAETIRTPSKMTNRNPAFIGDDTEMFGTKAVFRAASEGWNPSSSDSSVVSLSAAPLSSLLERLAYLHTAANKITDPSFITSLGNGNEPNPFTGISNDERTSIVTTTTSILLEKSVILHECLRLYFQTKVTSIPTKIDNGLSSSSLSSVISSPLSVLSVTLQYGLYSLYHGIRTVRSNVQGSLFLVQTAYSMANRITTAQKKYRRQKLAVLRDSSNTVTVNGTGGGGTLRSNVVEPLSPHTAATRPDLSENCNASAVRVSCDHVRETIYLLQNILNYALTPSLGSSSASTINNGTLSSILVPIAASLSILLEATTLTLSLPSRFSMDTYTVIQPSIHDSSPYRTYLRSYIDYLIACVRIQQQIMDTYTMIVSLYGRTGQLLLLGFRKGDGSNVNEGNTESLHNVQISALLVRLLLMIQIRCQEINDIYPLVIHYHVRPDMTLKVAETGKYYNHPLDTYVNELIPLIHKSTQLLSSLGTGFPITVTQASPSAATNGTAISPTYAAVYESNRKRSKTVTPSSTSLNVNAVTEGSNLRIDKYFELLNYNLYMLHHVYELGDISTDPFGGRTSAEGKTTNINEATVPVMDKGYAYDLLYTIRTCPDKFTSTIIFNQFTKGITIIINMIFMVLSYRERTATTTERTTMLNDTDASLTLTEGIGKEILTNTVLKYEDTLRTVRDTLLQLIEEKIY